MITTELYGDVLARLTEEALTVAITTTLNGYKSITSETLDKINQSVLDYVVAGANRDELKDQLRGALTGLVDVRGRPMQTRAETFTQDAIMKFNRTANELTAKLAGVKNFMYYGNAMDTTREFCRQHIGKVKTREEWERIGRETNWDGKSSNNLFISCGGYNCRHHLMPVFD